MYYYQFKSYYFKTKEELNVNQIIDDYYWFIKTVKFSINGIHLKLINLLRAIKPCKATTKTNEDLDNLFEYFQEYLVLKKYFYNLDVDIKFKIKSKEANFITIDFENIKKVRLQLKYFKFYKNGQELCPKYWSGSKLLFNFFKLSDREALLKLKNLINNNANLLLIKRCCFRDSLIKYQHLLHERDSFYYQLLKKKLNGGD